MINTSTYLLVKDSDRPGWLELENITCVPIQPTLINPNLLTEKEVIENTD